ncbi:MAG: dCTP deaminase [Candidatus Binatia bacterium]
MILTREKILEEMAAGSIVVDPFEDDMLGPASVDLHLGDEIRVMSEDAQPVDVLDDVDFRELTELRSLTTPFALATGSTIHGITRERIRLSPNICGWLEGRSRFARLGLMIHVTAGFVAPGVSNRQVLEISNVSGRTLNIHRGTRICQLIFQRTDGSAVYAGRFAKQESL